MAETETPEDQDRLMQDAVKVVLTQKKLMCSYIEQPNKLMDALKCASTFVSELRTSKLGPTLYYNLYLKVFESLIPLADHLAKIHPTTHLADLYELVQYAGNIIPRLYLMITVGTVYLSVKEAPVKEILKDILEMSRGVQQPLRGLFLRYYLVCRAQEFLPSGDGDGPEGKLQDSISFLLTNFVEMNKLWVRLQHQGPTREVELRRRQRGELQQTVGKNLALLAAVVDVPHYKLLAKPLLEQVVQCNDVLAQDYLLGVVIHAFPDECHLATFDTLLPCIGRLKPEVDVKTMYVHLMERLTNYAVGLKPEKSPQNLQAEQANNLAKLLSDTHISDSESLVSPKATLHDNGEEDAVTDGDESTGLSNKSLEDIAATSQQSGKLNINMFRFFYTQITDTPSQPKQAANQLSLPERKLPLWNTMELLVSLGKLALAIYPDRLDYVGEVLELARRLTLEHEKKAELHSPATQEQVLELLRLPIQAYRSIFTSLALPNFISFLQNMPFQTRKEVASETARSLLDAQVPIENEKYLVAVLAVFKVIIRDDSVRLPHPKSAAQELKATQDDSWLARVVHLIRGPDNDSQFELLKIAQKAFSEGGSRIKFTYPPLVFACLKLVRLFKKSEKTNENAGAQCEALYNMMLDMINTLSSRVQMFNDVPIRLYIACAKVADQMEHGDFAYAFFNDAFNNFEEVITETKSQYQAILLLINALQQTRNIDSENYNTLVLHCTKHKTKRLVPKPDQCRAVYLASHMWWPTEIAARKEECPEDIGRERDGKRVLECLQHALRIADSEVNLAVKVTLFVEVLDRYWYFYEQGNESITVEFVNGLIELTHQTIKTAKPSDPLEQALGHLDRTLRYIESREAEGIVTDAV